MDMESDDFQDDNSHNLKWLKKPIEKKWRTIHNWLTRSYSNRSDFFRFKGFGTIVRLSWIFLVPAIFMFLIFNPFQTIDLQTNGAETQYVSRSEIDRSMAKYMLSEFFQTSLRLGWYDVCFENNEALNLNGQPIHNGENERSIELIVKEVLPSPFTADWKTIKAPPFKPSCLTFGSNNNGLMVGTSTIALGTVESIPWKCNNETKECSFSFGFEYSKLHLYIQQNPWAFLIEYIVLVLLWGAINLEVKELKKFIARSDV